MLCVCVRVCVCVCVRACVCVVVVVVVCWWRWLLYSALLPPFLLLCSFFGSPSPPFLSLLVWFVCCAIVGRSVGQHSSLFRDCDCGVCGRKSRVSRLRSIHATQTHQAGMTVEAGRDGRHIATSYASIVRWFVGCCGVLVFCVFCFLFLFVWSGLVPCLLGFVLLVLVVCACFSVFWFVVRPPCPRVPGKRHVLLSTFVCSFFVHRLPACS